VVRANSGFPQGMTERKARTGARFAREKQVLRCAQNDNQKVKGKSNGSGQNAR
jgi:hypothetical protein